MNIDFEFMLEAFPKILRYLPVTIRLTAGALVIAFPIALLFALVLTRKIPVAEQIIRVYLSILKGTPIILQMYIAYSLLPSLLQRYFTAAGININIFDIDNSWYAYIALSLSATAFLTEAFRSAMGSVDKGQLEAAYMVGLTGIQAYRRIVLPQMFGIAMPVITNTVVSTIKATSLAFAMSVVEVTGEAKILAGISLSYFEAYLDIFFVYIILICIVEFLLKTLERYLVRYRVS